jgi:hypothetical protein
MLWTKTRSGQKSAIALLNSRFKSDLDVSKAFSSSLSSEKSAIRSKRFLIIWRTSSESNSSEGMGYSAHS